MLAETGFPCPYRPPVTPEDGELMRLVALASVPDLSHVFLMGFDGLTDGMPRRAKQQAARMVTSAILSPDVSKLIKAERDKAAKESRDGGR